MCDCLSLLYLYFIISSFKCTGSLFSSLSLWVVRSPQVIVVPEGAEMMPRPSPDYPMLPTIPLSAFSDPKKIKSSHALKVGMKLVIFRLKTVAAVFQLLSNLMQNSSFLK